MSRSLQSRLSVPILTTIGLSLAAWLFFRFTMPDHPLSPGETAVIVLACYLLVLSQHRLRAWLRSAVSIGKEALVRLRVALSILGGRVIGVLRLAVKRIRMLGPPAVLALMASGCTAFFEALEAGLDSEEVACTSESIERLQGSPNPVQLRGWALPRGHGDPSFDWSAPVGRIEGTGAEVEWILTDVPVATHRATVLARDTAGIIGTCSVRVRVHQALRSLGPDGGLALFQGRSETNGYHLYAYLLLPVRPSAATRPRLTSAISYFTRVQAEAVSPTGREIVLYAPLAASSATAGQLADPAWVLERYDHDRARRMLGSLQRTGHDGPFLVISRVPLGQVEQDPVIVNDLSRAPPDLMDAWIKHQIFLAAGEGRWTEDLWRKGVIRLRTVIHLLAEALPDVRSGLDEAIRTAQL